MDVVAKHPRRMDQNVIYGSTNNGEMRERSRSEMVFNGPASREEKRRQPVDVANAVCASVFRPRSTCHVEI